MGITPLFVCLNRTFYGIETLQVKLIRVNVLGLNRTFYGIETRLFQNIVIPSKVLIVPFMELKLRHLVQAGCTLLS